MLLNAKWVITPTKLCVSLSVLVCVCARCVCVFADLMYVCVCGCMCHFADCVWVCIMD